MTRHVSAGDELVIPAATWNSLIGMLEQQPKGGGAFLGNLDPTVCTVKNSTGAEIPFLGVVGLSTPLILPTDNETAYLNSFIFDGVLPAAVTYQYKWGIALQPIAVNAFGTVRISGLCHCYIDLTPSRTINFAGPNGVVGALKEVDCGARVMYRTSGTGSQRAIVIL